MPLPDFPPDAPSERDAKIFVLVAVGVPTVLLLVLMLGIIGSAPSFDADFPFVHVNFNQPALLFANTPTGGDMGAHVLLPQVLRDTLLPAGGVIGWSNAWYAGFPAMYFYFPLPALFTVAADVVVPYGVAFKLSTIVGLVLLPLSIFVLARGLGFARIVSGFAAFGGSMFAFMESFAIYGGNIKSTMAGEFSFSWSLALGLFYLGTVVKAVREDRPFSSLAGVLLALTALSHIVTTMVVVAAALPLLARRRSWRPLLASWGLGFALSAFWALPLLVRGLQGLTTDMRWFPVQGLLGETQHVGLVATPFPDEFMPIVVVALIGITWTLIRRDEVSTLLTLTIVPAVLYVLLPEFGITRLYNGRLLPFWYLGGFIFAGIALGLAVTAVSRVYPQRLQSLVALSTLALLVPANVALFGVLDAPGWVSWNYNGYEGKTTYPEYEGLLLSIDDLPPGRIMWEINSDQNKYGTPMALMLIPYWSEAHQSMEGVFFESSITTPFHFLNGSEVSKSPSNPVRGLDYSPGIDWDRALIHLALFDVEHYISFTPEAAEAAEEAGLEVLARPEPWTIFDLPDAPFVDVAVRTPVVYEGEEDFLDVALAWYDDVEGFDYWVAAEGPDTWRRISELDDRLDLSTSYGGPTGSVSDVIVEDDRIEFTTDAVGRPHLVKMSYFPNWTATQGAEGPYRAAPSLMVVIPTEERVVLQFQRTAVENVGNLLTLAGVAVVAGWVWQRRRNRQNVVATIESP